MNGSLALDERTYQRMVESVRDYAIFMLDRDGHITSWNLGAERLKGYSADEIIGKHFSIFYRDQDKAAGKPAHMLGEAARNGTVEVEDWRVRKDGSLFWADVVITALRNDQGNLVGFTKVTRDLTERRRLEEELRLRADELEQQKAMLQESNEAMETFTYSISHDLRAPLRGIWGYASALLEDCCDKLDGDGNQYARAIVEGATRMDALIEDLLTYSRLSRTQLSAAPVDLSQTVADVVNEIKDKDRSANIEITAPLGHVQAHPQILSLVLVNLISNAVKFVKPGTHANVRIYSEISPHIVRLWVEDQGIGIAPEHQHRIFQPFERLHGIESYPGTGIGLAIVRKGIERMGGRLGVESTPGQGSRFWFELPKAERRSRPDDTQHRIAG
jgi:PAS domain S-box-containing protein